MASLIAANATGPNVAAVTVLAAMLGVAWYLAVCAIFPWGMCRWCEGERNATGRAGTGAIAATARGSGFAHDRGLLMGTISTGLPDAHHNYHHRHDDQDRERHQHDHRGKRTTS
ncbi:MAG: hypothetical protein ACRDTC_24690 [Pseudonocardiaceae bacterium]